MDDTSRTWTSLTATVVARLPFLAVTPIFGCLLYISLVVIYRLTLHPLAKYPGPILARITDWYSVYYAWKGDRHLQFYKGHHKYGEFVRFGPNLISVNSNAALKAIYGTKANTQKSKMYSVFNHFFDSESTETVIDKTQHARKRRVLSQALSDRALKTMENSVLLNVRRFCEHLLGGHPVKHSTVLADTKSGTEWSMAKNVAKWINYLSFDVMGDICFGESFDMMEREDNRYMMDVISDGSQGLHVVGHMPGILKLRLDHLLFGKLVRGLDQYKAYSKIQAEKRIQCNTDAEARDVFSFLLRNQNLKSQESVEGFTMSELVSESSLLIIAGSHTSAAAMSTTLFYLLHNPPTLEHLKAEVRSRFNDVEEIRSGHPLSNCHYLRACIDEAMRLSPPVGGLMPREVCPGGITIDGHFFPAGTDVGVSHYTLHHNEAYYPDPFTFKPSRWLVDEKNGVTAENVQVAQSNFCAFSIGPRGCVGKGMAYMEMMVVLARMIWLFEMRLAQSGGGGSDGDGEVLEKAVSFRLKDGEYPTIDKFVSKVDGPLVEFRAR